MEVEAVVVLAVIFLFLLIYLPYRALRALYRWATGATRREWEQKCRQEREQRRREEEYERLRAAVRQATEDAKDKFRQAIISDEFPSAEILSVLRNCEDELSPCVKDLLEQMLWGHCTAWEMDYAKAVRLIEQPQRASQSESAGQVIDPNRPVTESEAFELLGVAPGCTADELSNAYRRTVTQWHPDKIETMAQELRDYATRQTARINEAYSKLKSNVVRD
jgi:DnaJ-domain-containing protein 1